jgi:CPA1 family monovalent cation:H+ antiporter
MSIVYTILILLLVVALTGAIVRMLPFRLPLPLIQIAVGGLLALPVFGLHVEFDHELFFLLFIPPLLFADGWRLPRREFFLLRGPILTMAIGLVFFTVVGAGYFVHWMIPVVPLTVAFALASVLSPTDALAVTTISGGTPMPSRLLHLLEGEALLNDASGLVALQFAVAAALTGKFSFADASVQFLLVAAGGIGSGVLVSWLFGRVRRKLVRWGGEADPAGQVALLLLLPFAAYLLAESMHSSGILAAVAAGMTMNHTDVLKGSHVATRMQSTSVWGMVEFVFNGVIFVLLGQQLPTIVGSARSSLGEAGHTNLWLLVGYVLAITLVLLLLRFFWVWVSLRFMFLRAIRQGQSRAKVGSRLIWATALSGVRGAITLAAVLSLPLLDGQNNPFPARALMIFLATGVIITTLVMGSIGLPIVLKSLRLPGEDPRVKEERDARAMAAEAAIKAIEAQRLVEEQGGDENVLALTSQIGARVMADYQLRLEAAGAEGEVPEKARRDAGIERSLRLAALKAERAELYALRKSQRINDQTMRTLVREIDLAEASLVGLGGH